MSNNNINWGNRLTQAVKNADKNKENKDPNKGAGVQSSRNNQRNNVNQRSNTNQRNNVNR